MNGPAARRAVPIRHVMAVFVGNGLEFYDFLTFSYFAVYIARTFYPEESGAAGLLATLATFGAGFITRPIGAIVLGRMGDTIGRKPTMLITFSMMGFAITGLALTPSYAMIGYAAPALVLLFRLVQGFALGGEVGPTTAYMAESAPPHRRGFYLSMQYATQDAASLVAGCVGVLLANLLTDTQLQEWGWRAAMLLGASIVPFGLMLRRSLPETLHKADDAALAPDATTGSLTMRARIRPYLALTVLGLMMLTAGTIGSLHDQLHDDLCARHAASVGRRSPSASPSSMAAFSIDLRGAVGLALRSLRPQAGDDHSRRPAAAVDLPVLLGRSTISAASTRSMAPIAMMVIFAAISSVPVIVTITEQLPPSIRSGALATIYAFAISIFGGSTQFMIKWLITGDRQSAGAGLVLDGGGDHRA